MLLVNMVDQIMNYQEYITIEPGKRGGKPCIRSMRITVYDVLDWLASGMSEAEILDDYPGVDPGMISEPVLPLPPTANTSYLR